MILPFTIGRNLLETTLLTRKEIYGFSLFDVKYFFPVYLSDVFLLLIYQNYLSKGFTVYKKVSKLTISYKLAFVSFVTFIIFTAVRSIDHEFGDLIILSSIVLIKFLLIFFVVTLINFRKHKEKINQLIAASTLFQAILIIVEQFRGGNLAIFIEKTLPGMETGTASAEAGDILRANGTFNEPNIAAVFLLINVCIILPLAFRKILLRKQISSYLYLAVSLISLLAIIFTGSRSIYLLTCFVLGYYFLRYKKEITKIALFCWGKLSVKIAMALTIIVSFSYLFSRISSIPDVFNDKGSLSYRSELNRYVLLLSQRSILGIGLDMTPYYIAKNFKTMDSSPVIFDQAPAHNIFVQIITETGIFGLISFILFIYFALKDIIVINRPVNSFAVASIVYLFAAQFHPIFTSHPEIFSFFILYLSIANNLRLES